MVDVGDDVGVEANGGGRSLPSPDVRGSSFLFLSDHEK